jgi:hypothetical protein
MELCDNGTSQAVWQKVYNWDLYTSDDMLSGQIPLPKNWQWSCLFTVAQNGKVLSLIFFLVVWHKVQNWSFIILIFISVKILLLINHGWSFVVYCNSAQEFLHLKLLIFIGLCWNTSESTHMLCWTRCRRTQKFTDQNFSVCISCIKVFIYLNMQNMQQVHELVKPSLEFSFTICLNNYYWIRGAVYTFVY